jgi:AraC-like DNA-binding protein
MFSTLVLFVTAAVGFLCTAYILGKNKNQQYSLVNKYLIIMIAISAARYLVYGISQANPAFDIRKLLNFLDIATAMLMPCIYLYFSNIVDERKFEPGNLFHFIVPFLLGISWMLVFFVDADRANLLRKALFISIILFYLVYAVISFVLLYKSVWRRKSDIKAIQKQNELIKSWSIFLYTAFIAMVLIRILLRILSNNSGNSIDTHLWIPALLWLGVFVKLILTPEILYGYDFLNKTIDSSTEKIALSSVWLIDGTVLPITSDKDKKLVEKIKPSLKESIHQIENLSFHTEAFRNPDLIPDDIATALNIPISHINFIYKYHCNESFTDYKKIVRIHDATKLLKNGYLTDNTVESLSTTVGFASYNTFNVAFKSITGVTTQDYIKRIVQPTG